MSVRCCFETPAECDGQVLDEPSSLQKISFFSGSGQQRSRVEGQHIRSMYVVVEGPRRLNKSNNNNNHNNNGELVLPGQPISEGGEQLMAGYGTSSHSSSHSSHSSHHLRVSAAVLGRLLRVNRLLTVRPSRQRYRGDVGDVALGRVHELQARRWRIEVGAAQLAVLQLSAINLPGGVLRRRTDMDALNMRLYFVEGDVVCCEVQAFHADGVLALHTRSLKYGKLRGGQLIRVDAALVKRDVTAFHELDLGDGHLASLIMGANGWFWIGAFVPAMQDEDGGLPVMPEDRQEEYLAEIERYTLAQIELLGSQPAYRKKLAAITNIINMCNANHVVISIDVVRQLYERARVNEIQPHHIMDVAVQEFLLSGGGQGAAGGGAQ